MAASNPPAEPPTPTIGQPVFFVEALLFPRADPDSRACDRRRAAALLICRFEAMALFTISYGSWVFKMRFHYCAEHNILGLRLMGELALYLIAAG